MSSGPTAVRLHERPPGPANLWTRGAGAYRGGRREDQKPVAHSAHTIRTGWNASRAQRSASVPRPKAFAPESACERFPAPTTNRKMASATPTVRRRFPWVRSRRASGEGDLGDPGDPHDRRRQRQPRRHEQEERVRQHEVGDARDGQQRSEHPSGKGSEHLAHRAQTERTLRAPHPGWNSGNPSAGVETTVCSAPRRSASEAATRLNPSRSQAPTTSSTRPSSTR